MLPLAGLLTLVISCCFSLIAMTLCFDTFAVHDSLLLMVSQPWFYEFHGLSCNGPDLLKSFES